MSIETKIDNLIEKLGFSGEDNGFQYVIEEMWAYDVNVFTDWWGKKYYPELFYEASADLEELIDIIAPNDKNEDNELLDEAVLRIESEHEASGKSSITDTKARLLGLLYKSNKIEDLAYWMDRYDVTPSEASGAELLMFAIDKLDEKEVKALLDKGVRSEIPEYSQEFYHVTPMELAFKNCNCAIVNILLAGGFELPKVIHSNDNTNCFERDGAFDGEIEAAGWGENCLMSAYLYLRNCEECLQLYAPYDQRDSFGNNILHYLALDGVEEIPSALTEPKNRKGISDDELYVANFDDKTPLHLAIEANNWGLVLEIIDYQPDLQNSVFEDIAEAVQESNAPYEVVKAFRSIGLNI